MQEPADTSSDPSFRCIWREMKERKRKPAQGTAGSEALSSDGLQELLKNFRLSPKSHVYPLEDHIQNYATHKEKTSFMQAD